jgi:hypothetical protein
MAKESAQKVNERLTICREAEKANYRAKVEYIHSTMLAMLDNPMQEIDNTCLRFIYDTFDRAKELNGHV